MQIEPIEPNYWQEIFLAEVENDLNMPRAMSVVWAMLRAHDCDPTTKLRLLFDFDRILGFDLKGYLQNDTPARKADSETYLAALPGEITSLVRERESLRTRGEYIQADQIRSEIESAGYTINDTPHGGIVLPRRLEDEFTVLSSSSDAPDNTQQADLYEFSVNLLAHNSQADIERCIQSICRHSCDRSIELVIIDNGSTDETLAYLEQLARQDEPGRSKWSAYWFAGAFRRSQYGICCRAQCYYAGQSRTLSLY